MEANNKPLYLASGGDFIPDMDSYINELEAHNKLASKIYEKFELTEHSLNIKRAVDFVSQETNTLVDCSIYIVREGDRKELRDDLLKNGYDIDENDALGYGCQQLNTVVVFVDDSKPIVNTEIESEIVHEITHLIGFISETIEVVDDQMNVNKNRSGFSIKHKENNNEYGKSFEEALSEHYAVKYRQKFGDKQFFSLISKYTDQTIHDFDESKTTITCGLKSNPNLPFDLPLEYASCNSEGLLINKPKFFAYLFELMQETIYERTGEDLEKYTLDAKKDPHKIKNLADLINETFGKGTYVEFQKLQYQNGFDLQAIIDFKKHILSDTKV